MSEFNSRTPDDPNRRTRRRGVSVFAAAATLALAGCAASVASEGKRVQAEPASTVSPEKTKNQIWVENDQFLHSTERIMRMASAADDYGRRLINAFQTGKTGAFDIYNPTTKKFGREGNEGFVSLQYTSEREGSVTQFTATVYQGPNGELDSGQRVANLSITNSKAITQLRFTPLPTGNGLEGVWDTQLDILENTSADPDYVSDLSALQTNPDGSIRRVTDIQAIDDQVLGIFETAFDENGM